MSALFRPAALAAKQTSWLGEIVLIRPLSFTFLTAFAAVFAAIVVLFLCWGGYTKRSTVTGQLVPDAGLVKVYTQQPGVVLEKRVLEGQRVQRGEVLYVLSSERQGNQGEVQAGISRQVQSRQHSLQDELGKTRLLQQEEREALAHKIDGLQAEAAKLDGQIDGQRSRVKLAEDTLARYQGLLAQDFIAREQVQQRQEELLDQRARLQGLERERIAAGRELAAQRNELSGLSLKHQNQLAAIERSIAGTSQELAESEAKRSLLVTAPEGGMVTAGVAEVGQTVEPGKPLISVVPLGARMQAHLYAPSRAVGFVKPGDAVLLRYQAYPYQKFGHVRGRVLQVARTALLSQELAGVAGSQPGGGEPVYRITVELAQQTINAYGKPQPLQAGMLLDADVLQDTRRLYEWVLEPLYSLTGKL
ncbi:MAG TPA: HlyD family efflux transporter periplasmic adaptor subunit [Cellvibrionaceae bacterium]|nr:HlyD family efflux transporter periplasmic adaptor subunit [Cellvibrionaceae bacterium]